MTYNIRDNIFGSDFEFAFQPQLSHLQQRTSNSGRVIEHTIEVENEDQAVDPILYEPYEDAVLTPCNHVFSRKSIEQWLQDNHTCPIDRKFLLQSQIKKIDKLNIKVNKVQQSVQKKTEEVSKEETIDAGVDSKTKRVVKGFKELKNELKNLQKKVDRVLAKNVEPDEEGTYASSVMNYSTLAVRLQKDLQGGYQKEKRNLGQKEQIIEQLEKSAKEKVENAKKEYEDLKFQELDKYHVTKPKKCPKNVRIQLKKAKEAFQDIKKTAKTKLNTKLEKLEIEQKKCSKMIKKYEKKIKKVNQLVHKTQEVLDKVLH